MSKSRERPPQPSYGEAAERLERILARIEEGQVDIDELSGLVAEAAELVTLCRTKIRAAETRVRTITEQLERATPAEGEEGGDESTGDLPEDVRY